MSNQKLFEIIGSFTLEEREAFPLFLKSPFFVAENKSEEILQLFRCFLNAANGSKHILPDKAALYVAAYAEKTYSEARLQRACTKLGQLTEQFLTTRHYTREENTQQQALDFLGILRRKKLNAHFQGKLQSLKKEIVENHPESSDHYEFKYHLLFEEQEWECSFNTGIF